MNTSTDETVDGEDDDASGYGDAAEASGYVLAEPKRLNRSTLVLLGLILAGAGGTYLMMHRSGPATASASTMAAKEADKTITQFLSGGQSNLKSMEEMLRSTEKVVQQFLSYPSMTQIPLSDLHTNPFRHAVEAPTADRASEVAAKKREQERLAALQAVQGLQLQSIMVSETRRAAMINNSLVQEGQQVDGFAVEKINASAVVVKSGIYRFELKMQK